MKLSQIAHMTGCSMMADEDIEIKRIAGIDDAGSGDLTFVSNRKYLGQIKHTRAAAIILAHDVPPVELPSLRTDDPYLAFAKALELFYTAPHPARGIHPLASIAQGTQVGTNASIGAFAVIAEGCHLGNNVTIYPHAVLYSGVTIGNDAIIHAHVVIREFCRLGDRVIVQNGAIIGGDGFGFAPMKDGSYYKIVQSGRVILEDDVEIGSNTTIDRAAVGDTIIRRGTKLDNLVQIGHGAQVGEHSVLAAQVGVAGSTHIGRQVQVGGQAGFAGHSTVGDKSVITAQSGTSHDIEPGAVVSGSPAFDNSLWLRAVAAFQRLPDLVKRIRALEKQLAGLKASKS